MKIFLGVMLIFLALNCGMFIELCDDWNDIEAVQECLKAIGIVDGIIIMIVLGVCLIMAGAAK